MVLSKSMKKFEMESIYWMMGQSKLGTDITRRRKKGDICVGQKKDDLEFGNNNDN